MFRLHEVVHELMHQETIRSLSPHTFPRLPYSCYNDDRTCYVVSSMGMFDQGPPEILAYSESLNLRGILVAVGSLTPWLRLEDRGPW